MATNQKKKVNENENVEITNVKTIDIPIDDPKSVDIIKEETEGAKTDYKDIDAVCKIFDVAKRERDSEEEQRRRDEEKDRRRQEDNALAAQKAENEKARQAEENRKINESRYIRKKMRRNATAMLFCLCIMSAVFGYVVAGILIHIIFDPKVWIFVGVIGIFGMINTLIHTHLYRYIRGVIYHK